MEHAFVTVGKDYENVVAELTSLYNNHVAEFPRVQSQVSQLNRHMITYFTQIAACVHSYCVSLTPGRSRRVWTQSDFRAATLGECLICKEHAGFVCALAHLADFSEHTVGC